MLSQQDVTDAIDYCKATADKQGVTSKYSITNIVYTYLDMKHFGGYTYGDRVVIVNAVMSRVNEKV